MWWTEEEELLQAQADAAGAAFPDLLDSDEEDDPDPDPEDVYLSTCCLVPLVLISLRLAFYILLLTLAGARYIEQL